MPHTRQTPRELQLKVWYDIDSTGGQRCSCAECTLPNMNTEGGQQAVKMVTVKWVELRCSHILLEYERRLDDYACRRGGPILLEKIFELSQFEQTQDLAFEFAFYTRDDETIKGTLTAEDITACRRIQLSTGTFSAGRRQIAVRGELWLELSWHSAPLPSQLSPTWLEAIPLILVQIGSQAVEEQQCRLARVKRLLHYWRVLGPIFCTIAFDWNEWDNQNSSLPRAVMLAACRLAFLLPESELFEVAVAVTAFSYRQSLHRKHWATEEMVDLVAQNLQSYDRYLDEATKVQLLEWIYDHMRAANVKQVTFTGPLLQYMGSLVDRIDHRLGRRDPRTSLLYKIMKVVHWVDGTLAGTEGQSQPKQLQLTDDEDDKDSLTEEEAEGEQGEEDTPGSQDDTEQPTEAADVDQDDANMAEQVRKKEQRLKQAVTRYLRRLCRSIERECEYLLP